MLGRAQVHLKEHALAAPVTTCNGAEGVGGQFSVPGWPPAPACVAPLERRFNCGNRCSRADSEWRCLLLAILSGSVCPCPFWLQPFLPNLFRQV